MFVCTSGCGPSVSGPARGGFTGIEVTPTQIEIGILTVIVRVIVGVIVTIVCTINSELIDMIPTCPRRRCGGGSGRRRCRRGRGCGWGPG